MAMVGRVAELPSTRSHPSGKLLQPDAESAIKRDWRHWQSPPIMLAAAVPAARTATPGWRPAAVTATEADKLRELAAAANNPNVVVEAWQTALNTVIEKTHANLDTPMITRVNDIAEMPSLRHSELAAVAIARSLLHLGGREHAIALTDTLYGKLLPNSKLLAAACHKVAFCVISDRLYVI